MLTNSNILNFNHSILTTETLNKIRNSQKQKLKKKGSIPKVVVAAYLVLY